MIGANSGNMLDIALWILKKSGKQLHGCFRLGSLCSGAGTERMVAEAVEEAQGFREMPILP